MAAVDKARLVGVKAVLFFALSWPLAPVHPAAAAVVSPDGDAVSLSCPSPTTPGSTILASNPLCFLTDSGGNGWRYTGTQEGANRQLSENTGGGYSPLGSSFWSLKLQLCPTGRISFQQSRDSQPIYYYFNGRENVQSYRLCAPFTAQFFNTTTSTNYGQLSDALYAVAAHQTIHGLAMPPGVPFYADQGATTIGTTGVTVNLDKGVIFDGFSASQPPGQGMLIITAADATLHGGEFRNGPDTGIRVDNGAAGARIENTKAHDFQSSNYLTGGSSMGTTTANDIVSYHGGLGNCASGGQDHNVYFGENGTGGTNSVFIKGITSYDVFGGVGIVPGCSNNGGWTLKIRPGSSTVTGDSANYYIGCQVNSGYCEQNGVVDYPCAGNHTISHVVLEEGPKADNWFVIRIGEEIAVSGDGPACPHLGFYAANAISLDHAIVIWDNPNGAGNPGYIPIICAGSGACSRSGSISMTISNSIIIGDSEFPTFGSCSGRNICYGPKVTDGGGNSFYTSRSAYATAKSLNFTDQFGNLCAASNGCPFPAVPPRI